MRIEKKDGFIYFKDLPKKLLKSKMVFPNFIQNPIIIEIPKNGNNGVYYENFIIKNPKQDQYITCDSQANKDNKTFDLKLPENFITKKIDFNFEKAPIVENVDSDIIQKINDFAVNQKENKTSNYNKMSIKGKNKCVFINGIPNQNNLGIIEHQTLSGKVKKYNVIRLFLKENNVNKETYLLVGCNQIIKKKFKSIKNNEEKISPYFTLMIKNGTPLKTINSTTKFLASDLEQAVNQKLIKTTLQDAISDITSNMLELAQENDSILEEHLIPDEAIAISIKDEVTLDWLKEIEQTPEETSINTKAINKKFKIS